MSPPYLPGNAPVPDIVQPLEIGLFPVLGIDLGFALGNGPGRLFRQRSGLNEPLLGNVGFDRGMAAIAMPHAVPVFLLPGQKALLF